MVSVVVPLFNRWDLTADCVRAIQDTCDAEIVLVDNGSTDATRRCDVQVRNLTNRGFAVACNQGAWYATGDTLVFLNNDTIVQPGWLEPLVAGLEHAAVAGAQLVYPDGRIQHAGVQVDFTRPPGQEAWGIQTDRPSGHVPAVTGACLAIRRHEFIRLGGFDDGYWNGYEDVDLCLKAGGAYYVAESRVVHLESQSGPERWRAVRENVWRLRDRWS